MPSDDRQFCRRCLLEQTGQAELIKTVSDAVAALPQEQRINDVAYQNRLAVCRGCKDLMGGVCRYCGCFVQLRAAKKRAGCPSPYGDKWS